MDNLSICHKFCQTPGQAAEKNPPPDRCLAVPTRQKAKPEKILSQTDADWEEAVFALGCVAAMFAVPALFSIARLNGWW